MVEIRSTVRALTLFGLCVVAAGCAHTVGEIQLSDGNYLVITGYGTEAEVSQVCLSAQTVTQLTTSLIPPEVGPRSCYWVQMATTNSSAISKAVDRFVAADNEFQQKISNLISTQPALPGASASQPPAAQVANKIVAKAIVQPQNQVVTEAANIPDAEKPAVQAELTKLIPTIKSPEVVNTVSEVVALPLKNK